MKFINTSLLFSLLCCFCNAKNTYWCISSEASIALLPLLENCNLIEKELAYSKNSLLKDFRRVDSTYKNVQTVKRDQTAIFQFIKHKDYTYLDEEKKLISIKLDKNYGGFFIDLNTKVYDLFWDKVKEFMDTDKLFIKCNKFKINENFALKTRKTQKSKLLSFRRWSSSSNGDQIKENIIALASCEESFSDKEISEIEPIITDYVNNSEDKDPIFEEIRKNGLFVPDFSEKKGTCSIQ